MFIVHHFQLSVNHIKPYFDGQRVIHLYTNASWNDYLKAKGNEFLQTHSFHEDKVKKRVYRETFLTFQQNKVETKDILVNPIKYLKLGLFFS